MDYVSDYFGIKKMKNKSNKFSDGLRVGIYR